VSNEKKEPEGFDEEELIRSEFESIVINQRLQHILMNWIESIKEALNHPILLGEHLVDLLIRHAMQ
jgi:hypothetical protein